MICVDHLIPCIPNKNWKWDKSAHLFVIDEDEEVLHKFARRIGLKQNWFQGDHYDLCPTKHSIAIQHGATLVDRRSVQMRQFLDNRVRKINRIRRNL
jgi:hypothetical protein